MDDDGYDIVKSEIFLESRGYHMIPVTSIEKGMTVAMFTKVNGERLDMIHISKIENDLGKYFSFFDYRMMVFFRKDSHKIKPVCQNIWLSSDYGCDPHDSWPLNNSSHRYYMNRIYLIDDDLSDFIKEECTAISPGTFKGKDLCGISGFYRKHISSARTIDDFIR